MYKTLEEVPLAIRDFYHEELVSEAVVDEEGNLVYDEEPYTYTSVTGDEHIGYKLIQVYEDVYMYVLNDRTDLMLWTTVYDVMSGGNTFEYVSYCVGKAVEREQWMFYDLYIQWLGSKPEPEDGRYLDEGNSYDADLNSWELDEPMPYITDRDSKIIEYTSDLAIQTRYEGIYESLVITLESGTECVIDVGKGKDGILGIDNVKDAIMAHTAGMTVEDGVSWIMADNSVELVSYTDLTNVVVQFNIRKQNIFNKYSTWRGGDKLTPFVL